LISDLYFWRADLEPLVMVLIEESVMKLTIEIVAGKSIGPFQLGMTFEEIEKALRSFSSEPVTLADLGIVA
jgi:hypothetical protein